MKSDWTNPDRPPTPEQLAAFADGELTDSDHAGIEAWLRHDASAAAEVETHRRLTQLYRDAEPPLPSDEAWSSVRQQIEVRLHARPLGKSGWSRRWLLGMAATFAAAAAAIFLLVNLKNDPPAPSPLIEPYAVVSPEDVAILSICGCDTDMLVAARPPIELIGENELATRNDAEVLNREPHIDGVLADMRFTEKSEPMLITPPAGWELDP